MTKIKRSSKRKVERGAVGRNAGSNAAFVSNENLLSRFKSLGLKATQPRIAVATALASAQSPLSGKEINRDLQGVCDKATIYRILQNLEAHGLVHRIELDGTARFIWTSGTREDRETFIVCRICRKIARFHFPKSSEHQLSSDSDFILVDYEIYAVGTCQSCANGGTA